MKTNKPTVPQNAPKGVRMQWQPLKEVKPVRLSSNMASGRFVSEKELKSRNNNSDFLNVLVP
jgi:hypothetical protein